MAGALAVTKLTSGPLHLRPHGPARRAGPCGHHPLRRAPARPGGLLRYVVGLAPGPLAARSTRAVVRSTASGAVLATFTPPPPYSSFEWVSAAADDRTFVLSAALSANLPPPPGSPPGKHRAAGDALKSFLLRLFPASGTARLAALPVPAIHGRPGADSGVAGIALSPDGSSLAVAMATGQPAIRVYDLRDGSAREWAGARRTGQVSADRLGATALSWAADGRTLALDQWRGLNIDVRLLDTTAPGASLGSARRVMTFANWPSGSVAGSAITSPDGTKIIAMAVTGGTEIQANEFSARTGAALGTLVRLHYQRWAITGWPTVEWSDPSGSTLIVSATRPGTRPSTNGDLTQMVIGVVTRGRFQPLPQIPAGEMLAW